jgi:hypothetical protein
MTPHNRAYDPMKEVAKRAYGRMSSCLINACKVRDTLFGSQPSNPEWEDHQGPPPNVAYYVDGMSRMAGDLDSVLADIVQRLG